MIEKDPCISDTVESVALTDAQTERTRTLAEDNSRGRNSCVAVAKDLHSRSPSHFTSNITHKKRCIIPHQCMWEWSENHAVNIKKPFLKNAHV